MVATFLNGVGTETHIPKVTPPIKKLQVSLVHEHRQAPPIPVSLQLPLLVQ